eukprot:1297105-Rhodomonas_salina.1
MRPCASACLSRPAPALPPHAPRQSPAITAHSTLHCTLKPEHCTPAHCTLHTAHCILHTAHTARKLRAQPYHAMLLAERGGAGSAVCSASSGQRIGHA